MNKTLIRTIVVVIICIGGFLLLNNYTHEAPQVPIKVDYKNATYTIDGKPVQLKNGVSETETAPDSASKIITRYFGNEVRHDLNDDGREDIVFLLTQETGGSGTFYYVVAALNKEDGYVGSHGLLLGDRIAPQTTEMGRGNIVIVNYADRATGESFATPPSIGKSIWLLLDARTLQFGEVEQNFEGEADPSRMTLTMKPWQWISALYNDGTEIKPRAVKAFTIIFSQNGAFSATTDCNRVSGSYTVRNRSLSFEKMISTKMYCEGSQESAFTRLLSETDSYHFTSKGELILDLKFDSGSVVLR